MSKIAYILTNPSMPGLTKIGAADDLPKRMRELYKTNVPAPFECFFAGRVDDAESVKRNLHSLFDEHRVSPKREFFRVDPQKVRDALKLANPIDVTPKKSAAENNPDKPAAKRKRSRGRIDFSMVRIPVGTILTLRGDETITCRVVNDREVEFDGKTCTLSSAAAKALQNKGRSAKAISGPVHWCYEGEALYNRRLRLEKET